MNIKIHSLRFDADIKLINFVENKVGKLDQYYNNIIGAEVTLRIDNSESDGNKVVDIKMLIPGNDLFSKRQARSFEKFGRETYNVLFSAMTFHEKKHCPCRYPTIPYCRFRSLRLIYQMRLDIQF